MKKVFELLLFGLICGLCSAQTSPVWYTIPVPCPEGCTLRTVPVGTTLRLGSTVNSAGVAGSYWQAPLTTTGSSPKLPMLVSWPGNSFFDGTPDPDPGVTKWLQFAEQIASYTVSYTLAGSTVVQTATVPALSATTVTTVWPLTMPAGATATLTLTTTNGVTTGSLVINGFVAGPSVP